VDVRLTGEDGYQAQRSYSIASAPEAPLVALTVERIEEGEVSTYLVAEVQAADRFELRGHGAGESRGVRRGKAAGPSRWVQPSYDMYSNS